jgi:hypothetical protein
MDGADENRSLARTPSFPNEATHGLRSKAVSVMQQMNRRALIAATRLLGATGLYAQGPARDSAEIARDLPIAPPGGAGAPQRLALAAAMHALNSRQSPPR